MVRTTTYKRFMAIVIITGYVLMIIAILSGCGAKKPTQLESNAEAIQINNRLLESRYSFVPKDAFLSNSSWVYSVEAVPSGDYFFKNEQMVKVFLLAHNCQEIIILGEQENALAYKRYLKSNGVEAFIRTQPIELNEHNKKYVKLLFFSSKIGDKSDWDSVREINENPTYYPFYNGVDDE